MAEEESSEESVQIFEGALYTVQQRLDTFKGSYWPYETGTCTPLKVRGGIQPLTQIIIGYCY